MEIKQGDKFILEVGKEYNPDDSDKDPIYHILNTNLFITKYDLSQLDKFVESESEEQDRVNLLYECIKMFLASEWKDKHAMLNDDSNVMIDMLSKISADQFINKVTEYYRDIRVGDICRHKIYGYKCIVVGIEKSNQGNLYLCTVKSSGDGFHNTAFHEGELEKIGKSSYGVEKILQELS